MPPGAEQRVPLARAGQDGRQIAELQDACMEICCMEI